MYQTDLTEIKWQYITKVLNLQDNLSVKIYRSIALWENKYGSPNDANIDLWIYFFESYKETLK